MTRIYTNVPSLTAQKALTNSMGSLSTSLQRLSTGLRINSGKDDPAGLIASEMLRSDIAGVNQAIKNTQQGNNMIAVADSALNQVSELLITIRSLVTEAANTAVMSDEMIAANQLQVDATLNSIDRISSSTTFMGKQLLDGSQNFVLAGVDRSTLQNVQINEAQFGTQSQINVSIAVQAMAEKAQLKYNYSAALEDISLTWKGNLGVGFSTFQQGATISEIADVVNAQSDATGVRAVVNNTATYGRMQVSSVGANNDIIVTANEAGLQSGFIEIKYTKGSDRGIFVEYEESLGAGYPHVINVQLQTEAWQASQAKNIVTSNPAGVDQNSALDFLLNIEGGQFNGASINIVDGNLTNAGFNDAAVNPSGVAGGVNAFYAADAVAATALVGDINGLVAFQNLAAGSYIQLTANTKGNEYNNVAVQFVADDAGTVRGAAQAKAVYTDNGSGSSTLFVYVNTNNTAPSSAATFNDIVAAINTDKTFSAQLVDKSSNLSGGSVQIARADTGTLGVTGNTNNSGGDAGTLFIYATTVASTTARPSLVSGKLSGFTNDPTGVLSISTNTNSFPYNASSFRIVADDSKATGVNGAGFEYNTGTGQLTIYVQQDLSTTFQNILDDFTTAQGTDADLGRLNLAFSGTGTNTISAADLGVFQIGATTDDLFAITPKTGGGVNNAKIVIQEDVNGTNIPAADGAAAVFDASGNGTLTIWVKTGTTFADIQTALTANTVAANKFSMSFPGTSSPATAVDLTTLPQTMFLGNRLPNSSQITLSGNGTSILSNVANVTGLSNLGAGEVFQVTALNNSPLSNLATVNIVRDDSKATGANNAGLAYDTNTRILTVYVKEDFSTTFQNIQDQFAAEAAAGTIIGQNFGVNITPATLGDSVLAPADVGMFQLGSATGTTAPGNLVTIGVDPSKVLSSNTICANASNTVYNASVVLVDGTALVPPATTHGVSYDSGTNAISITFIPGTTTYQEILDSFATAAANSTSTTYFPFTIDFGTELLATQFTGADDGLGVSNIRGTVTSTAIRRVNTAQDIADVFNLNLPQSIGSERAASMFSVTKSIDNDGTGLVYSQVYVGAFSGGVTGGDVISTAQDVVAALNNSAYWNTLMTPAQIAEFIANAGQEISDCDDTTVRNPILWATLNPGDHGLNVVSEFQEVAYYGKPSEQNAIQFLGPTGAPDIRFVADKGNNELFVDFTTTRAADYSWAILNGVNQNAQVVLQANQKGGQNDDVLFQFVRVNEDPTATPPVLRDSGWVTYDGGTSRAQALATFSDRVTGNDIANTAFTVTANDRGNEFNNVGVLMRQNAAQTERVLVTYDVDRKAMLVSLRSDVVDPTTAPAGESAVTSAEIVAAINKYQGTSTSGGGVSFTAELSNATVTDGPGNNGTGIFNNIGLTTQYTQVANTGTTGGHTGGTVTVYLVGEIDATTGKYVAPTANQVVNLMNADDIVASKFTAKRYTSDTAAGTGAINFVKDNYLVSAGGAEEKVLTVHLRTDKSGIPLTTAAELVSFWDTLSAEQTAGISASLWREPGAEWDICADTDGMGILRPSGNVDNCDNITYEDIQFGSWGGNIDSPIFAIDSNARGKMVAVNGVDASFDLVARTVGPAWNNYSLVYSENNDPNASGLFDDGGLRLDMQTLSDGTNQITIYVKGGRTTANDVKQLIESDPMTKLLFTVELAGNGMATVDVRDNSLMTTGGALPPSSLNGARLLGGTDGEDIGLTFVSTSFGSDQYVEVTDSKGNFLVKDASGNVAERSYGTDASVLINGVRAVSNGLGVSLNTTSLSIEFDLNENTEAGYSTSFRITGGGGTFQMGARVVSNQQITIGIPSVHTAELGGPSGRLVELRDGQSAALATDPGRAYKIIEEAIVRVTEIRGRLGTIQASTFEPNISVLQDTLEALSTAQSQIRDTDFAAETSEMTKQQVLVQSGINALGVANQLPNYILSLLR